MVVVILYANCEMKQYYNAAPPDFFLVLALGAASSFYIIFLISIPQGLQILLKWLGRRNLEQ